MVLAAQFESFLHPFTIMLSLPLSIVWAFGGLWVTGQTLNIFSMIGMVMLMGLVTKNAILLVDYTNLLRREGMEKDELAVESLFGSTAAHFDDRVIDNRRMGASGRRSGSWIRIAGPNGSRRCGSTTRKIANARGDLLRFDSLSTITACCIGRFAGSVGRNQLHRVRSLSLRWK